MLPVPDTRSRLTAPQNFVYEFPVRSGNRQRGRQWMAGDRLPVPTADMT